MTAGVDVAIPDGFGCAWRDALAAVATATTAIRFRFGAAGLLGAVTPARVAVAASGGRLLAPGLAAVAGRGDATPVAPDAHRLIGDPRQGACPATGFGQAFEWRGELSGVVGGAQAPRARAGDRIVPVSADLPGAG